MTRKTIPALFLALAVVFLFACSSKKERISCITVLDCPGDQVCEEGFCTDTPDDTGKIDRDTAVAVETGDEIADELFDDGAESDENDGEIDDSVVVDEDAAETGDDTLESDDDSMLIDEEERDDALLTEVDEPDMTADEDTAVPDDFVPDEDTLIDECTANDNPCNDHGDSAATCTDAVSGYTCNCTFGFDPTLGGCYDIDECAAGTDTCGALDTCTNTVGGFTCAPNFCGDGGVLRPTDATLLLPFNEGSGNTAYDRSGNGNNGAVNGATWVDGRFGKALQLSGGQAVTLVESATLKTGEQLTVTAWIQGSTIPSSYVTIIQKDGTGLRNYGLFITGADQPADQGKVLFSLTSATPNDWRGPVSSVGVIDGLWHHLAGVYNGIEMKIFVDGVERGSQAVTVTPADTDGGVWLGGGFTGLIDEVRLYRRALGSAEITELANRRVHLPFEESAGTIAYDLSGNTRNGTLHNAVSRVAGRFGKGLFFDGVDDALQWDYADNTPVNNFTMMAWFTTAVERYTEAENTTTTSGTRIDNHYLFWPDNKDTEAGAGVSVGTNGISVYEHGNAYMPPLAIYDAAIGTGWNHVAVTYTDRQPRIYLNGVLVREGLVSPRAVVYAPQLAGVTSGFYGVFSGNVDDLRIYDRPLSGVEITAIMQNAYHDELCDDGNFVNDDGCSTACAVEPGF